MTDQRKPAIGTVAEETARLIEAVAQMARTSSSRGKDRSPYAGGPAQETASPDAPHAACPADDPEAVPSEAVPSAGACCACSGERDGTPVACRLCPLCQLIALLRSVQPETVDRLADLASAVAESLRDMATHSRASGAASTAGTAYGSPSDRGRATVQDIPVDDESEE